MPKLGDLSRWLGWKTGVQPTERIDGVTPLWKEKPTELCRLKFSDADPRMYVKGQFYTAPTFGDGFTQVGFGRFRDMLVWTGQFLDAVGRLPRVEWDYP